MLFPGAMIRSSAASKRGGRLGPIDVREHPSFRIHPTTAQKSKTLEIVIHLKSFLALCAWKTTVPDSTNNRTKNNQHQREFAS